MKRTIVISVILALVAVCALAAVALAQGPYGGRMMGPGGMMGGYGRGVAPGQAITQTVPYGGMMGGYWPMGGFGMMGGWSNSAPNAAPVGIDQAITRMQNYVTSYNNADLKLVEVEEYTRNFYGVAKENSTGTNAFQILVDKSNGAVYPEMGPNMMWNTKYSPMARMMGGFWFNANPAQMTVTVDQARGNATSFLKTYLPDAELETATDTFYGYYNIDILQNGKTYGMLSVNGYTGAVWNHIWHGDFVQAKELD